MTRFQSAILATSLVFGLGQWTKADDQEAKAVIEKAINALGGAQKLDAAKTATWKSNGKITIEDNDNKFTSKVTAQGINHFRQEFEADFNGNPIKGITVLDGDKAWRKFGEDTNKIEDEALANEKRVVYLQIVAQMPTYLNEKGFKVESVKDENVDGKPAAVLKVTGPEGKDFQLFFDKQSGLPVRFTATVNDFQGEEYKHETTFSNYKDFDGLKRATKSETKRNGKKFIDVELTEFKVVDKLDPKAFAAPKSE
jgi:hypothetical protein